MVLRRARGDRIESVLTAKEEQAMDSDLLYTENVLIKEEYRQDETMPKKIAVINRYRYTDNDTLTLKNYRLSACPGDAEPIKIRRSNNERRIFCVFTVAKEKLFLFLYYSRLEILNIHISFLIYLKFLTESSLRRVSR